ncbi:hypothetical protein NE237_003452 [Protea cynaroides]|uniref:Uncharacterized protein n=1 Tax=Protea cynaroides TaxID=273540 RepID=A0A9Q0KGS1_9MAGN|nr:hypothetical protein NE237_003452 [Protea cynaroides]
MASTLSLHLQSPPRSPLPLLPKLQCPAKLNFSRFQLHRNSSYLILKVSQIFASSSPSSLNLSNWDREEQRWLGEEQWWLCEEQQWLRKEACWNSECEFLLCEISDLKLRVQASERHNTVQGVLVSETIANIASLLQVLKDVDLKSKTAKVN